MADEYVSKTDEEIKQLAMQTLRHEIFWSTMAPIELVPMLFMPLALSGPEHLEPLRKHSAVPYEFMDKAGPRSVNGYPCFFSLQWVSFDDYKRVVEKLTAIEKAMEGA